MQIFENAVRTRVNVRICAKARICVSFALHLNVFLNHFFWCVPILFWGLHVRVRIEICVFVLYIRLQHRRICVCV